jgi:glycosyltransferase involved in cell wall biosynthesis
VRLCVVGPTYPYRGGISHYTTLLVRHLRDAGHETHLYSFTRQYPRWLFPGKTDADPSSQPLRTECEYILDPVNPLTWRRLYRRVRAAAPDMLILQWWVPYWTPCLTAISRSVRRSTDIPILYICHNVIPHEGGGPLDRRLAKAALGQGHAFLVHSEADRKHLLALLPGATVVKAHHPIYAELANQNGALSPATLRERLRLPSDRPVLLFFGLVRPYKGLEVLIQALPRVLERLPVHVLVAGEFWSPPEVYERVAREAGVEGGITFVDRYVPNEELRAYFDLANVVVLPYVSATQSGVAQLAFGCGKPVITTQVGGLPEIVEDGSTGLLVPPGDPAALAAAIVRYFEDGLGPAMAAAVQESVARGRFSWQALVQTIEELQQRLVAEQRSA